MKKEISNRLMYLDPSRGFYTWVIVIAHAFSHLMFWDMQLIPLEDFSIWLIIILSPIIIIATCAPVFVLISGTALTYSLTKKIKPIKDIENFEKNPDSQQNLQNIKNPTKSDVRPHYINSLAGYGVLLVASFIHISLFHYGLHWNGEIQRTVITSYLETGSFSKLNVELLFQTDAVGLIAFSGILNVGILTLLWNKQGIFKVKRNVIILLSLAVGWFILSPFLHNWLDPIFWNSLNSKQYLLAFLLKLVIGPPQSAFPNFAWGFIGMAFGILFSQYRDKKAIFSIHYGLIFLSFLVAGILVLINGFSLSPDSFGLFLPFEIQILDLGVILCLQVYFIYRFEFSTHLNHEKLIKQSTFFRRFGYITLTIYIFESVLCLLNMKWYVPLWNLLPDSPIFKYLELFGFVGLQVLCWYIIITLWEKKNFKFSLEWFMIQTKKVIFRAESHRLDKDKIHKSYKLKKDEKNIAK